MRINTFIAAATGLSRRVADKAIEQGNVLVNGTRPSSGQDVTDTDEVLLSGKKLTLRAAQTIILHKPVGYVVSRDGQGSQTVYDLLPLRLHHLKPVGRLDKDSSGLLLLTSDGQLAQELTHPKYQKTKIYEVELDREVTAADQRRIEQGIQLEDGLSKFGLTMLGNGKRWRVTMQEGRNRQIRRTFAALRYSVQRLQRTQFGDYTLPKNLPAGNFLVA